MIKRFKTAAQILAVGGTISSASEGIAMDAIPNNFHGYYALSGTSKIQCARDRWTADENATEWVQMNITGKKVLYYEGSVSCDVQSVRPTNKISWPRNEAVALDVDLTCYDEGTVANHNQTWHLVQEQSDTLLVTQQEGRVPELWKKCVD